MDGDGSAEDISGRLAHHMLSQLRDEIRQGFENSSAKIVEEIKQLLSQESAYSVDPCTIGEVSNGHPQTFGIDCREPKYQDELGLVDEKVMDKKCSDGNRSPSRLRRLSSGGDLERHGRQVSHVISKAESLQKMTFGRVLDNVLQTTRQGYLEDQAHQHKFLYHVVQGKAFSSFCMIMILANAAWMGYESDRRTDGIAGWLKNVGLAFNIWFAFELLMKIIAYRTEFFIGTDRPWNLLDLFLVLSSFPEYIFPNQTVRLSVIRILRLARLTRAFRVVRLLKYLSSLREILISLFYTLASLFWSFVAMMLATYVWALLFMQSLSFHIDEGVQFEFKENFTTVRDTMVTMYSCITGGMEWHPVMMDFARHGAYFAEYGLLFYVFFMTFGFVNVVIGVFCAKASEASNNSQEMRSDKEQEKITKMVTDLVQIFNMVDIHRRGFIEKPQFLAFVQSSEAQTMLQSHGLPTFAVEKMWRIMDEYDGTADDRVYLVSFIMGFMRLSGNSIATEVMLLSLNVKEMRSCINDIAERMLQMEPVLHQCASRTSFRMSKDARHWIQAHKRKQQL